MVTQNTWKGNGDHRSDSENVTIGLVH